MLGGHHADLPLGAVDERDGVGDGLVEVVRRRVWRVRVVRLQRVVEDVGGGEQGARIRHPAQQSHVASAGRRARQLILGIAASGDQDQVARRATRMVDQWLKVAGADDSSGVEHHELVGLDPQARSRRRPVKQ